MWDPSLVDTYIPACFYVPRHFLGMSNSNRIAVETNDKIEEDFENIDDEIGEDFENDDDEIGETFNKINMILHGMSRQMEAVMENRLR